MLLRAVFFDMDGVLVDTMKYHVRAWVTAFNESGYYPTELAFYLNEGVKHPQTVRERLAELGITDVPDDLVEKIYKRKRQIYDEITKITPTDGVVELLDKLKGKVKIGLVTGGIQSVVERALSQFKGYFDIVVDYESTKKGKPDPEPYLCAIEKAGVPKESIIAIENSPTGVASAVDAGLTCWAICTTLEPKYLGRATRIFKNFAEIQRELFTSKDIRWPA
ncbi:MAG: HAD family phosphatase [candidate division Zixibacteria bacterium]|nr:HAD family phosphatase [candidate division Zixibacteria bacterium]